MPHTEIARRHKLVIVLLWILDVGLSCLEALATSVLFELAGLSARLVNGTSALALALVAGHSAAREARRGAAHPRQRAWDRLFRRRDSGTFDELLARDGLIDWRSRCRRRRGDGGGGGDGGERGHGVRAQQPPPGGEQHLWALAGLARAETPGAGTREARGPPSGSPPVPPSGRTPASSPRGAGPAIPPRPRRDATLRASPWPPSPSSTVSAAPRGGSASSSRGGACDRAGPQSVGSELFGTTAALGMFGVSASSGAPHPSPLEGAVLAVGLRVAEIAEHARAAGGLRRVRTSEEERGGPAGEAWGAGEVRLVPAPPESTGEGGEARWRPADALRASLGLGVSHPPRGSGRASGSPLEVPALGGDSPPGGSRLGAEERLASGGSYRKLDGSPLRPIVGLGVGIRRSPSYRAGGEGVPSDATARVHGRPSPRVPRPSELQRAVAGKRLERPSRTWTPGDLIIGSGCPLERHVTTTEDGVILRLTRIPRPGARRAVFYMHGLLDSSLGWLTGGLAGSHALAAFEAGLDVWLGDSRANPPWTPVDDRRRGARYWDYDVGHLGRFDVAAFLAKIKEVKEAELGGGACGGDRGRAPARRPRARAPPRSEARSFRVSDSSEGLIAAWSDHTREGGGRAIPATSHPSRIASPKGNAPPRGSSSPRGGATSASPCPFASKLFTLDGVGHSLGTAMLLIHSTDSLERGVDPGFASLVLLAPAGFNSSFPFFLRGPAAFAYHLARPLRLLFPGRSFPLHIPSAPLRALHAAAAAELSRHPALRALVGRVTQLLLGGDPSDWASAAAAPHYARAGMPGISFVMGAHLAQWTYTRRFLKYDMGSPKENLDRYGSPDPPSIPDLYPLLAARGMRVHIVMGTRDGICPPWDVARHVGALRDAGVRGTVRTFPIGHLDVTLGGVDDVIQHVLAILLRGDDADDASLAARGEPAAPAA